MNRDDVIRTLNELIEISKDGEEGFRTCAEGVKNPQLKMLFEKKAERCALAVAQLAGKARELGGDPERGGSPSGMLHRFWVNMRASISGMDDEAALAECR